MNEEKKQLRLTMNKDMVTQMKTQHIEEIKTKFLDREEK